MVIEYRQSAIREVRDQLFLDHADGNYLNIVSANLGLTRPPYGFTDDLWRAVARIIGINYKQVATQFEEVFAVLFGPKVTKATSLSADFIQGDLSIFVHSTENIPQVGTLVIDEGLATEETFVYRLINRYTNEIFLDTTNTFAHALSERDEDASVILAVPASNELILADTSLFPTSYPYTLVVGRGTSNEETVEVINNDTASRTLTVTALANSHTEAAPSSISSALEIDYTQNTYYVQLAAASQFPDTGVIQLTAPPEFSAISGTTTTVVTAGGSFRQDQHIGRSVVFFDGVLAGQASTITGNTDNELTFTALGSAPSLGDNFYVATTLDAISGTVNDVTAAALTFIAGEHAGSEVTFIGNITASLAGVTARIISNTADTLTFENALGAPPAVGDSFYFRPVIEYSRASYTDNTLTLINNIPTTAPKGTKVELLDTAEDAVYAQVKIAGSTWDVIQTDPRNLELLIPDDLEPASNIRSVSYLHPEYDAALPSTTLAVAATVGDSQLSLTDLSGFSPQGVLEIDSGTEYIGYYRENIVDTVVVGTSSNDVSGAVIGLDTGGLTINDLIGQTIAVGTITGVCASNTASTITLTEALENEFFASLENLKTFVQWYDPTIVNIAEEHSLDNSFAGGVTVTQWQLNYPGTSVVSGSFRDDDNLYPGPYVYEFGSASPTNIRSTGNLVTALAGPMQLQLDQILSRNALEVDDASFMPLTGFPYDILIGSFSAAREAAEVTDVGIKQLTETTVDQASAVSQEFLEVVTLGTGSGFRFPNADGYRVRVGRGTANDEIIYVTGLDGTAVPPQLFCEPMVNVHSIGETVELMADVIAVADLRKDHTGVLPLSDRSNLFPEIVTSQYTQAATLQPYYSTIEITNATGLPDAGSITLNYGHNSVDYKDTLISDVLVGSSTFTINDSSLLPTGGFPYSLKLGYGSFNEEIVFVTANNTGLNQLTISSPARFPHLINDHVVFSVGDEETFEYSDIAGNTLSFSSPIVLESNHHINETALGTDTLTTINEAGFDFPLRLPPSLRSRIEFLFDLLRAAGVQVSIISAR